jgi:lysophospholipase L1-like esterase
MLLDQAKDVCQKSGTVFGLIYVPFAGVQGPIVQRAQNGLADWARTRNVPFIDVSLALSREKADVLTFDGMHLRPHGNEVVATEIVKQWGIVDEAMAVAAATQKSQ